MDQDDIYEHGDEDDSYDWLYVEDDYPLADELAETSIAEPGYSGTNFALAMEGYEFDIFGYWDDLEWGNDTYWDGGIEKARTSTNAGEKRKRASARSGQQAHKRPKLTLKETDGDNIMFVSVEERLRKFWEPPPFLKSKHTWALLPDWRERFLVNGSTPAKKQMPAEMRKAAAAEPDTDTPTKGTRYAVVDEDLDNEHEGDGEEEDEGVDEDDSLPAIDPETLKAVLKQHLGTAGLNNTDEAAFMSAIANMLSRNTDVDTATSALADGLLGKATEGNDTALAGWLSQQGVSLDSTRDDQEQDEETASVAATSGISATATYNNPHASPPDSAVEVSQDVADRDQPPGQVKEPPKKRAKTDITPTRKQSKAPVKKKSPTPPPVTRHASTSSRKGTRKRKAGPDDDDDQEAVPAPKRATRIATAPGVQTRSTRSTRSRAATGDKKGP